MAEDEGRVDSVNPAYDPYQRREWSKEAKIGAFSFQATMLVWSLEFARWLNINEKGLKFVEDFQKKPREYFYNGPPPEPIYYALQHAGDFTDGWSITLLGYYAARLLTKPFKDKIPENIKLGAAFFLGAASVIDHETGGILSNSFSTADLSDIPAGVIGSVAFVSFKLMLNHFIKDCSVEIQELETKATVASDIVPAK